jgi:hypothetical protein
MINDAAGQEAVSTVIQHAENADYKMDYNLRFYFNRKVPPRSNDGR